MFSRSIEKQQKPKGFRMFLESIDKQQKPKGFRMFSGADF